jgi:hypothetical protein
MQKLEINNVDIPISDQIVAITKKAYEFTDLSTRNLNITNRIRLQNTQEIREIYEHPELLNANNNSFEKYFPGKLFDNTLLFSGVSEVQNVNDEEINIQLIDSFQQVFKAMKLRLNQLSNIDSYNFVFSLANYQALRQKTSSVWVWPICNMRDDASGIPTIGAVSEAELKYSRPMFQVDYILDEAFDDQSWAFDRSLIPDIDKLLLSANHEAFYVSSYLKTFNETVAISGSQLLTGLDTYDFKNAEVTAASNQLTIDGRKTSIRLRGGFSCDKTCEIQVLYAGVKVQSFIIDSNQTEIDLSTNELENSGTATVQFNLVATSASAVLTDLRVYTLIEEEEFGDLSTNPLLGFLVVTYDNLPELSQFNVFKNALVLFNGFILSDKFTSTVEANRIGALDKLGSVDWSDKYIKGSERINDDLLQLYKKSYLGYTNDDTLTTLFGSAKQDIDSEKLEDEGFILQIDYSASKELTDQSELMADLPIYGTNDDPIETRLNTLDQRLLYYNESGSDSIASFNEIDFTALKVSQFTNLLNSLTRPRVLEPLFNLTKLDVLGFDFKKTVYIDAFKSHFYVLSIDNYEPSKLTRCKLLKF